MSYNFRLIVNTTLDRTEGKFPSRDSMLDELTASLDDANPGSLSLDESEVEVSDWSVEEAPEPPKALKVTPKLVDAALDAYTMCIDEGISPVASMRAALKAVFRKLGHEVEK